MKPFITEARAALLDGGHPAETVAVLSDDGVMFVIENIITQKLANTSSYIDRDLCIAIAMRLGSHREFVDMCVRVDERVTRRREYPYTVTADVDDGLAGVPARIRSTDGEIFTLEFDDGSAIEAHFTQVRERTIMREA